MVAALTSFNPELARRTLLHFLILCELLELLVLLRRGVVDSIFGARQAFVHWLPALDAVGLVAARAPERLEIRLCLEDAVAIGRRTVMHVRVAQDGHSQRPLVILVQHSG